MRCDIVEIGHLNHEQQEDVRAHVAGLTDSDQEFNTAPEGGWHCFHCAAHFRTVRGARLHFGETPDREPACLIGVSKVRAMEEELDRYRREDSDKDREFHAMRGAHATALIRAEEEGYAKGLADGRALGRVAA